MALPSRLGFGIFLAPFHAPFDNPTLALQRDLELLEWLDYLGYDMAWIGEHHSCGWETIASPALPDLHRGRGGADQEDPAWNRSDPSSIPPPVDSGQPDGSAGPSDARQDGTGRGAGGP